jgi:hypothetical protein
VNAARRCGIVVAWALAIGATGCDGSIDLLPPGAGIGADAGTSADAGPRGSCAPAPPGKPAPMGPGSMMPKATPSVMPACDDGGPCPPMAPCDDGGPCPPMMAPCEIDADAGLLDGPAVTP